MHSKTAASFDFTPRPDGNVRIEFYDDGGTTIGSQVITAMAFASVPLVAFITLTAMKQGAEVAKKLIRILREVDEAAECDAETQPELPPQNPRGEKGNGNL